MGWQEASQNPTRMKTLPYVTVDIRLLVSTAHLTLSVRLGSDNHSTHIDFSLVWDVRQWEVRAHLHKDKYMSKADFQFAGLRLAMTQFRER